MITILSQTKFRSIPWRSRSKHDLAATLKQKHVRPIALLFKVGFQNYFTEMISILRRCVASKFGSIPWRSQTDLAAKTCPAHNVVIWSRILQLFDRKDHYIEMLCQYLAYSFSLCVLYCIILSGVTQIASFCGLQKEGMFPLCTS